MTLSNYQIQTIDLDYIAININDANYTGVAAAVTNRKTVIFGQQLLTQTYPVGNIASSLVNQQNLLVAQTDNDSTNITGVGPTAVFYKSRANPSQSLIRANFSLLENTPQSTAWQQSLNQTNRSSPVQVGTSTNWSRVACGYYHTAAIQSPSLYVWGLNSYGNLGQNNLTNRSSPLQVLWSNTWTNIYVGYQITIGIQSPGTLWAWGLSNYGQLGLNTVTPQLLPSKIGQLNNWTSISMYSDGYSVLGIQSPGTLWAWGNNSFGQLGLGDQTNRSIPVQVGALSLWTTVSVGGGYTVAIQSPGTLWTWGTNGSGQLGTSNTTNYSSPVQVGAINYWTQVACGYAHTVAIQSPGTLWAWGYNAYGQMGNNTLTNYSSPVQIGALNTWTQIAAGQYHTVALLSNGTLWTWGNNISGQLGTSNQTFRSSPVQVGALNTWSQISAAGFGSTAAIQSPGTLWMWGINNYGQLGLGQYPATVNKPIYGL